MPWRPNWITLSVARSRPAMIAPIGSGHCALNWSLGTERELIAARDGAKILSLRGRKPT